MPTDPVISLQPATKGDVASALITTTVAVASIEIVLRELMKKYEFSDVAKEEMERLRRQIERQDKIWADLTGYVPDE